MKFGAFPIASAPTFLNRTNTVRIPYVKYLPRCDIPVYKIGRAARRAFLDHRCNDNTHNVTKCFSARKRYFRVLRLFFAYFFLARQKIVCRRRHSCGVAAKNGPFGESGETPRALRARIGCHPSGDEALRPPDAVFSRLRRGKAFHILRMRLFYTPPGAKRRTPSGVRPLFLLQQ